MTAVRTVFAAAHVVMKPSYAAVDHAPERPGAPAEIAAHVDWDATTAIRRHLVAHGFGVAEAMDTAHRNELDWSFASELIRRCTPVAPGFVAGAGADHLDRIDDVRELAAAVAWQAGEIHRAGGVPILLSLPWLTARGLDADAFVRFYRDVLERIDGEVLIHWLGPMFLPSLAGYFPGDSFDRVMDLAPEQVRGCKLSLLDAAQERRVRDRLLPRGQIVLTGDDLHFADLIVGDDPAVTATTTLAGKPVALGRFSHALLGILDGLAVPARRALELLGAGDVDAARERLGAMEELGRVVFEPPTMKYKAGLAFLSWLNGRQENAMLPNHVERTRDREHFGRVAEAARRCGALDQADVAAARLAEWERHSRS